MITVFHDPAGICKREEFPGVTGLLLNWLVDRYGPDGFAVPTRLFKNSVCDENEIILDDHMGDGYPLMGDENIIIVHNPLGLDPFTIFAIGFVLSLAIATILVSTPSIPEFKQPTESPNNSLTGQTNIVRPQQRIPDIFGKNKIFPDLGAKTYFEFVNHVKIQNEFMILGRGEFLREEVKTGDTLLSTIAGTVSTFFEPFTAPAELLDVTASNEVNGQNIIGPNIEKVNIGSASINFTANNTFKSTDVEVATFEEMIASELFDISSPSVNSVTGVSNISFFATNSDEITSSAIDLSVFSVGDIIVITGTVSNNVTAKVLTSSPNTLECVDPVTEVAIVFVNELNVSAAITNAVINAGTFTFSSFSSADIGGGITEYTIIVTETTFTLLSSHPNTLISQSFKSNETENFRVPGNPDAVWFDIQMPKGLRNSDDFYTIDLTLRLQRVDLGGAPIGSPEDTAIELTDSTVDPRFYTFKVIPAVLNDLYDASIVRTTDSSSDVSISDQTKWTRLAGVEDVTVSDFGNVTSWFVTTRATEQATSVSERKFNLVATRKLPTHDGSGGMTGVNVATARMADAAIYILTDPFMGNKSLSEIDVEGLYAIQDALDSDAIYGDKLGRFCYSFSNARTSVGDEVNTALRACRMFRYQEGNIVKFGRDATNSIRSTIFNRRIKRPDSETKTRKLFKPNDFDGIELEWVDELTNDPETIVFPESVTPSNPKKIQAAGVKNYEQSWNLANIEFNKLQLQDVTVSTTVHRDGLLVFPNARIGNVDSTTLKTQDGEIIGFSGLIIETSEPIDFQGNPNATVILRDENGDVSDAITVTARGDTIDGFVLSSSPGFTIRLRGDVDGYQIGTLYDFAPDSNHLANDYLVQEITPSADGYVDLKLINYDSDIYLPDTTTPTPEV